MTYDEVGAGQGDVRRRRSYWRAMVISGITVLGAAIAVPVVLEPSETPATGRPAMMMNADRMSEMMKSGPTMQPGQMMPGAMMMSSGQHMMDPAQMAEMMKSGQMMNPGAMMGQGQ